MGSELRLAGRRLNEKNKWLSLFPAEVWQMILGNVNHPGDMYNCAMASPLLENLLEPHKITYLFNQVMKVADDPSIHHQKPNLLTYLAPEELLKCRLVSTAWDEAITPYLESRPYHSTVSRLSSTDISSHLPPNFRNDPAYLSYLRLYTIPLQKISSLLPSLNSARYQNGDLRCPTPTRHLEILECLQERPEIVMNDEPRQLEQFARIIFHLNPAQPPPNTLAAYRQVAKSLLEKVGPSFWHLTIQTKHLQNLQEYVELMPNLKSLYILSGQDKECMAPPKINQTFPTLQNLNKLHFEAIPDAIVKLILDANSDVEVVEILRKPFEFFVQRDGYVDEDGLEVDLEETHVKLQLRDIPWPSNPSIFATSIRSYEELFGMPINWRRLSILRLDFKASKGSVPDWVLIFRKLEAYQDSLSELYLGLPQNIWQQDKMKAWEASKKPLKLPLLKRLELTVRSFSSLDFLLGLTALEYLRLRLEHTESKSQFVSLVGGSQVEQIDFNDGFADNFLECNIWNLMPNLKEVNLRFSSRPAQIYKRSQLNKYTTIKI